MDIYTKKVIDLASGIPFSERLQQPSITHTKRTPVWFKYYYRHDYFEQQNHQIWPKSQCLCSRTSVRNYCHSKYNWGNIWEVQLLRNTVKQEMLISNGPIPTMPFEDFEALTPARDYKNRHPSILLILDTIIEGI